ncbi:MAG: 4Fe-4S binding protein [Methanobacteriaceae archaeon]|jgi:ferredoxin|nr:4Fe-4S binding protein [Candidatus Methanorudis spinitermitis]
MEIKLKKKIKDLQKEIILKYTDFDNDIEDFKLKTEDYEANEKIIAISSRCIRCNLCVEECPVDAITSSSSTKTPKIKNNCVKCEICVQTGPISCIYIIEATSFINEENDDVEYFLKEKKVPHRILRMEKIELNREKCSSCGTCTKFCPTNAISMKDKSIIEAADNKSYPKLEEGKYPYIKKNLCIGCGACVNLCSQGVFDLERTLGPVIETKLLDINQDACVGCSLCEENCPVEAISLKNGNIVLDNESCIKCNLCSSKCPVNALSLREKDN